MIGGGNQGYHGGETMPFPNQGSNIPEQIPQQMQVTPQPLEIQEYNGAKSTEELNKNGMNKCLDYSKRFEECMKSNFNNTSICAQVFEDLRKCQINI